MSEDSPLSNQNQAVRDTAKEIARRILTYVANKENGISDLMKETGKAGFVVEVLVVLKPNAIQKFVPAEKPKFNAREVAPERPGRAELQTASDMGISLDDVESVEAQVQITSYEAVLRDLRERATKLSPKVRDWVCRYVSYTFPQLNVRAPGPKHLSDDNIWVARLGNMISKMMTLPDPQKKLEILLSHMERLKNE